MRRAPSCPGSALPRVGPTALAAVLGTMGAVAGSALEFPDDYQQLLDQFKQQVRSARIRAKQTVNTLAAHLVLDHQAGPSSTDSCRAGTRRLSTGSPATRSVSSPT